jgi:Na+-transporting NADH:ubiquinone oxidoreductase subunit NqrD
MNKKLLVTLVAAILAIAVIGSCYATYIVTAEDVTVNISAGYQSVTLVINNDDNSAAQTDFALSGFAPDATTQVLDVALTVDHYDLVDGVHGVFAISVSNTADTLGAYLTTTVQVLDDADGNVTDNITTDATGEGYDVALSATPVYVRITFTLNSDGIANFATIAETSASVALTWEIEEGSLFVLDPNAYYLVGNFSNWEINVNAIKMSTPSEGTDLAVIESVALTGGVVPAGDEFKIKKGDTWYGSYSPSTDQFTNNAEQIHINVSGHYRIRLDEDGHSYITYLD